MNTAAKSVVVGEVRLAYHETGEPAAPPMVLVHGLGSSGASWETVAAVFGARYHVYAVDLRGHGASDWPGTYSFELMREDLLGFLDALAIDRVTLVGHSMGGSVALLFAESYPDRLHRLVIEDTPAPFAGGDPVPVRPRPDGELGFDWPVIESIVGQLNDPDPAWWARTTEIPVPTLVIAGGPDSHVPQDRIIDMTTRIPRCTLATIPIGHHIHRDRPTDFVRVVGDFLSGG